MLQLVHHSSVVTVCLDVFRFIETTNVKIVFADVFRHSSGGFREGNASGWLTEPTELTTERLNCWMDCYELDISWIFPLAP